MKTRCKNRMLICTAAINTPGCFVDEQDMRKGQNKNNQTIEAIQPVRPHLFKEKKPTAAVANATLNTPKGKFDGHLATGLITVLRKVQRFWASLNNYQLMLEISIVTPKTVA